PAPVADGAKAVPDEHIAPDSLTYFVHFQGLEHDGWLKLDGFDFTFETPIIGGGSGGGAGKAKADGGKTQLGASSALVDLTKALGLGTNLSKVEVEAYKINGTEAHLVDEFIFSNVRIASLDTTNATDNSLSFDFGAFSHGHVELDSKGSVEGTT